MLDAEAPTATLGKTAGKDAQQGKPTYVSVLGVARAKALAEELRARCAAALMAPFGDRGARLRAARGFHRAAQVLIDNDAKSGTLTMDGVGDLDEPMYELLKSINSPHELRQLERSQLPRLADELRQFLVESVSQTGGHLSSNLGTVELTIALHYVFDTPHDRLVWDVGHQTYGHKILTGRREGMKKLRMWGGISGFPRREESEYDTFGTAHSSTSISAALGMAVASKLAGDRAPVRGDHRRRRDDRRHGVRGAQQRGRHGVNLLVILNDNDMSISPPVGALNKYLAKLMSGRFYTAAKRAGEKVLGDLARRAEEHVKGMVTPGTMFEEFGFNYIGPIDGHDLDALMPTLHNIKQPRRARSFCTW